MIQKQHTYQEENWRKSTIPSLAGIEVSSLGRVKYNGEILRLTENEKHYKHINLNGIDIPLDVLVADTWYISNRDYTKLLVRHKNSKNWDCTVQNLCWSSPEEYHTKDVITAHKRSFVKWVQSLTKDQYEAHQDQMQRQIEVVAPWGETLAKYALGDAAAAIYGCAYPEMPLYQALKEPVQIKGLWYQPCG